jgi:hypothetical protein
MSIRLQEIRSKMAEGGATVANVEHEKVTHLVGNKMFCT